MLIDLSCPVENQGITVRSNSETGDSYLLLKLYNISEKTITSLNYIIKAFDENGTEITSLSVELNDLKALPNEYFAENKAVSLDGIADAKNFTFEVVSATFEDGEVYEFSAENLIDCDDSELSLSEALELRKLFPEAICYAKETDSYWRCPCGRPNLPEAENCVRCGYLKEKALYSFSSKSALLNSIKENEEELEKIKENELLLKEAKKKKIIKGLIISGIVILALVILTVAGYFIRNAVINSQADKALKDGDYLKAYNLYEETNNNKKNTLTDKIIGNNPSNLINGSGFLAEDEENLYFITYTKYGTPAKLIKESKTTKEKTVLTDTAYGCLNVVGDRIYFINNNSFPASIAKDGSDIKVIFETPISQMCVLGNDIYYIKIDYDNPKGLTEEECQILAAQGQIKSYTRIHKYSMKSNEDILVSEENISAYSIYAGKIYYLNNIEIVNPLDAWSTLNLKSMDLDGKNAKTVIDVPVADFLVKDNILYYIPFYRETDKGKEITSYSFYDCTIIKMDLSSGAKTTLTTEEDMAIVLNISGDDLVYISYDREEFMNYTSGEQEINQPLDSSINTFHLSTNEKKNLMLGSPTMLNVCGDNIFSTLSYHGLTRLSKDLSIFETVYEDGTSMPPQVDEISE